MLKTSLALFVDFVYNSIDKRPHCYQRVAIGTIVIR